MEQTPVSLSRRRRPMFLVRRSAASPGRGSGGFLWKERADNAALRQCLHDCAQIKDDTRIVGNRTARSPCCPIASPSLLGCAAAVRSREEPPHTPTTERLLTVRSRRDEGCGHGEAGAAFFARRAAFGVGNLRQKDNPPLCRSFCRFPQTPSCSKALVPVALRANHPLSRSPRLRGERGWERPPSDRTIYRPENRTYVRTCFRG